MNQRENDQIVDKKHFFLLTSDEKNKSFFRVNNAIKKFDQQFRMKPQLNTSTQGIQVNQQRNSTKTPEQNTYTLNSPRSRSHTPDSINTQNVNVTNIQPQPDKVQLIVPLYQSKPTPKYTNERIPKPETFPQSINQSPKNHVNKALINRRFNLDDPVFQFISNIVNHKKPTKQQTP